MMRRRLRAITRVGLAAALGLVASAAGSLVRSAPTYAASSPPWLNRYQSAERRTTELLAAMSVQQKLTLVSGDGGGIPALGIPPLRFTDGPNGIGDGATQVTAFPAAIALAATWDPSLSHSYGNALGAEAAGKGDTLIAAPTVNIVRTPRWGRAAETFGEDPFLTAQLAVPEITGIQARHVISEVKHFAAYSQEIDRTGEPLASTPVSANVSQRALQEIYFPAFRAAVQRGGAASVMCSYNRINGLPSCQDPGTLGVLKSWGLRGFIGPDATLAVRSDVAAANAGVDNFLLGSVDSAFGKTPDETTLTAAVRAGQITASRLDDMARRVLLALFGVGRFDHPRAGDASSHVSTRAHRRLATRIAEQGAVLLKDRHGVLPLSRSSSLAVIGPDAALPRLIEEQGSSAVNLPGPVTTPLAAIRARAAAGRHVIYSAGSLGTVPLPTVPARVLRPVSGPGAGLSATFYSGPGMSGIPTATRTVPTIDSQTGFGPPAPLASGVDSARWRGSLRPPASGLYRFSLTVAGTASLSIGGRPVVAGDAQFTGGKHSPPSPQTVTFQGLIRLTAGRAVAIGVDYSIGSSLGPAALTVGWEPPAPSLLQRAVATARRARVAIVFANDISSEGMDRPSLALPGNQDRLIEAVAAANPRTIVVLETSGPVLMPWLSEVAGVLEAWYPGQGGGQAIAATLFGAVDPSGRLPVTFPADEHQGPATKPSEYPGVDRVADFREGIDVGYRYYDQFRQRPLFPFGYGLSYTSFALAHLSARRSAPGTVTVRVRVMNTGVRIGEEVVELYVGDPRRAAEPPRRLAGFAKVRLSPAQERTVALTLPTSRLRTWRPSARRWTLVPGRYTVFAGTSSRDLSLRAGVTLP